MTFKEIIMRELHVALYGQSAKFRVVKYVILFMVFGCLYWLYAWDLVWKVLIASLVLAIGVHILFRWKTDAWTKSWGPYKRIKLNGE